MFPQVLLLVLLAVTSAQNESTWRPQLEAEFVTSSHEYFHSQCVYFVTTDSIQEHSFIVQTIRHMLRGNVSIVAIKPITIGQLYKVTNGEALLCNKPLFVMHSGHVNETWYLKQILSNEQHLSTSKWLLILLTPHDLDELFNNVYIPFNTEFIVATHETEDVIAMTEVFSLTKYRTLEKYRFGSWMSDKGLIVPLTGLYNRRNNLQGIVLRATNMHNPPISTIVKNNAGVELVESLSGDVWKILEKELNFTSEFSLPVVNTWGNRYPNGSWDGMMEMILKNQSDVSSSAMFMFPERAKYVRYSIPLFSSKFQVYILKPTNNPIRWDDILAPFSPALWYAFIAMTIATGFIMAALTWLVRTRGSGEEDHETLYDQLFGMFGAVICQQGQVKTPRSWPCRITFMVAYLTGVILFSSYSGSIVSHLMYTEVNLPFKSLEELYEKGTYDLGVLHHTLVFEMFKDAVAGTLKDLYDEYIMKDPDKLVESNMEGFTRMCGKQFAYITNPESAAFYSDKINCTMTVLPQHFFRFSGGIAFPKNSPYIDIFNNKIVKLTNAGVLKKLYKKYTTQRISDTPNKFSSISLENATPILTVLAGGVFHGLFVFLVELAVVTVVRELGSRLRGRSLLVKRHNKVKSRPRSIDRAFHRHFMRRSHS